MDICGYFIHVCHGFFTGTLAIVTQEKCRSFWPAPTKITRATITHVFWEYFRHPWSTHTIDSYRIHRIWRNPHICRYPEDASTWCAKSLSKQNGKNTKTGGHMDGHNESIFVDEAHDNAQTACIILVVRQCFVSVFFSNLKMNIANT